jgi:hypothetical protein
MEQNGAKKPMTPERNTAAPVDDEQISQWLEAVWAADPATYEDVQDLHSLPDDARVEQNSRDWAARFFSAEANPYNQKPAARRAIHRATADTFDVVLHDYHFEDMHLLVYETLNFFVVAIDQSGKAISETDEPDRSRYINQLAYRTLKMQGTMVGPDLKDAPYEWIFHFPASIGEGVRFSTNPEVSVRRMWSWAYRVDGGIHEGRLYFLCFKKPEMTSGKMVTLDGQHWFDGKCWAALQSGPAR